MYNYSSNQISEHVGKLIIQLHLKGRSINQIARELMIARPAVHSYLKEKEYIEVPKEAQEAGAKRYTEFEIAEMVRHYKEGKTVEGITEAYGISRSALYHHINKAGTVRRSTRRQNLDRAFYLYDKGRMTVKDILDETEVPRSTFYRHLAHRNKQERTD